MRRRFERHDPLREGPPPFCPLELAGSTILGVAGSSGDPRRGHAPEWRELFAGHLDRCTHEIGMRGRTHSVYPVPRLAPAVGWHRECHLAPAKPRQDPDGPANSWENDRSSALLTVRLDRSPHSTRGTRGAKSVPADRSDCPSEPDQLLYEPALCVPEADSSTPESRERGRIQDRLAALGGVLLRPCRAGFDRGIPRSGSWRRTKMHIRRGRQRISDRARGPAQSSAASASDFRLPSLRTIGIAHSIRSPRRWLKRDYHR